jgi:hypothetical protein
MLCLPLTYIPNIGLFYQNKLFLSTGLLVVGFFVLWKHRLKEAEPIAAIFRVYLGKSIFGGQYAYHGRERTE